MVYPASPHLFDELEHHIKRRTGWRVRNLAIEILPERAILRGQATSSVARQLAQHIVSDYFPEVLVENSIEVDNADEVPPGMPFN